MARKYDHIRAKAIELRTQQNMTLQDICHHLKLPKTTVYYWIKDIPSEHGLLTIEVGVTDSCARLQAWMDTVKQQW